MGPIRCPETSVNNYHTTPRNIPEERRSHQHRGGSLKSKSCIKGNKVKYQNKIRNSGINSIGPTLVKSCSAGQKAPAFLLDPHIHLTSLQLQPILSQPN
jgi:hypothetical protein